METAIQSFYIILLILVIIVVFYLIGVGFQATPKHKPGCPIFKACGPDDRVFRYKEEETG